MNRTRGRYSLSSPASARLLCTSSPTYDSIWRLVAVGLPTPRHASRDLDDGRGILLCFCRAGGIGHWRPDLIGHIVADPAFAAGRAAIRAEPRKKGDALQGLRRRGVETVCRRLRARQDRALHA